MSLPEEFLAKMKQLLKDDFKPFIETYKSPKSQGLRVNTLKIPVETFTSISRFQLEEIPWTNTGFYYRKEDKPGKHPYHEAGLYYIQEPSAMAAGEILDPFPGEKVLDLCAAPGGKTTHLAAKMNQKGLLVANEIHPGRAKILSQNIERMGIKNAVVTNESPEQLAKNFPAFYDRILVDAPCSGEGMFRKDPNVCEEWSLHNVEVCSIRQKEILKQAAVMLRPGGRLVYSTCTFSPEENEGVISHFLKTEPEFELEEIHTFEGFDKGNPDWIEDPVNNIDRTIRLWPHRIRGEGHYFAALRKKEGQEAGNSRYASFKMPKQLNDFYQFADDYLSERPKGKYMLFGDQLYIVPDQMVPIKQLKVLRPGWHLGMFKKNRFEPSHSLALSLAPDQVKNSLNFIADSPEIMAYLKGESLKLAGQKGWTLVFVDGYSIGWGKMAGGLLKNHFPKGLRWKI